MASLLRTRVPLRAMLSQRIAFSRRAAPFSTKQQSSDERYENTGEYDTQDANKRVGNPIQWTNPYDGPTMDDTADPRLRWVMPVGCACILVGALYSRFRSRSEKEDDDLIDAPNLQQYDLKEKTTLTTPTFTVPSSKASPFSTPDSMDSSWTPSPPPSMR
eukprot:GEMP01067285.1.p1 GENE.GEMP01067285.1~~GEMP01067285.1.p1  ORF type:complete len:160 (+),score=14.65 GEMP01067285.1:81-560(+)